MELPIYILIKLWIACECRLNTSDNYANISAFYFNRDIRFMFLNNWRLKCTQITWNALRHRFRKKLTYAVSRICSAFSRQKKCIFLEIKNKISFYQNIRHCFLYLRKIYKKKKNPKKPSCFSYYRYGLTVNAISS